MAVKGLTSAEVAERVQKGEVNSVEPIVSRSYSDIIIKNVCTTFNLILFMLGAILLILDEPINALAATFVIIFNICIATLQEMKAKRRLDKIALLMRPKVTVVRDDEEIVIDQSEIVKDDVIILNAGDQALVDGIILEDEYLELDESLLTGESRTVRKRVGENVYSGSYCVTGKGYYKVTAFGDECFASKMLTSAKKFKNKMSPLQIETTAVTKLLMSIAFILFVLMVMQMILKYYDQGLNTITKNIILNAVIVLDIVPIALFLLIVISYMIAAIRMADSGVLLQRSNSVESMSHVNTVCMDKTGTITTNKLIYKEMVTFIPEDEAKDLITLFANSTGSVNKTVEALIKEFGTAEVEALDEIRFSSERKYSAVKFSYKGEPACVYMGALSSLGRHLDKDVVEDVEKYSSMGLRTVILAKGTETDLYKDGQEFVPDLKTIAVIAIEDEVRPDCRDTLDVFLNNGMDVKVISGDDPKTVDSLFTIANIPGERNILSGEELDALEGEERTKAILETNIFGRMKPDHKEMIIATLKNEGRYVAMVGDGVNDVKSLKMANVGVALQSGSGAARGVADMVLVDDNFAALPKALVEGRRTVSGMRDILKIYLSRNFLLAVLVLFIMFIFASAFTYGATPFLPTQATFYAVVSVSIAAFLMTLWAQPDENSGAVLPEVLRYAIPTAIIAGIFAVVTYMTFYLLVFNEIIEVSYTQTQLIYLGWPVPDDYTWESVVAIYDGLSESDIYRYRGAEITARNAMLLFCILEGITQLFMVTPHWKCVSIDGHIHKDIKPTLLIFLLYAVVVFAYWFICNPENDWAMKLLPVTIVSTEYLIVIVGIVILWFIVNLFMLRRGVLDFITDMADRWYTKKIDRINHTNMLAEQGIKQDPFKEFTNTFKEPPMSIWCGMPLIRMAFSHTESPILSVPRVMASTSCPSL